MAELESKQPRSRRGSSHSNIPTPRLTDELSRAGGSDPEISRSSRGQRFGTNEGLQTGRHAFTNVKNEVKRNDGEIGNPLSRPDSPKKENEDNKNITTEGQNLHRNEESIEINVTNRAQINGLALSESAVGENTNSMTNDKNITPGSFVNASDSTPVPHNGSSQNFHASQMRAFRDTPRETFASRLQTGSKKPNQSRSTMSVLSKTSCYYHGDIVDENLLLSAARIDSTLLRLFSRSRDGEQTKKVLETEDKLLPFLNYSDSDLISMDAVLWRVHPMDAVHKATLEQEMSYLEENVKPMEILGRLYMDEVLTHMDYNTITRTEGQGERAVTRLLMKTLMRRGDKAFPRLISALQTLHYGHVSEHLQDSALKLRMAMEDEKRESQLSTSFGRKHQQSCLENPSRNLQSTATFSALKFKYLNETALSHKDKIDEFADTKETSIHRFKDETADVSETQNPDSAMDSSNARVDEGKLQEHLSSLDKELRALHDDVTALKTARSQSIATSKTTTTKPMTDTSIDGGKVPPKSSSCTVL